MGHEASGMNEHRILIATDGSSGANEAVETGLALARESGAKATLVYVRRGPHAFLGEPFYQSGLTEEFGRARAALSAGAARATELGIEADTEILEGHAASRILELARAREARLIVVGSRGRSAVAEALLGSVSNELVQKADRPVLVARHRARARRAA